MLTHCDINFKAKYVAEWPSLGLFNDASTFVLFVFLWLKSVNVKYRKFILHQ